jgi:Rrf2 family nitric oxide-sensitive transcriptional repressor
MRLADYTDYTLRVLMYCATHPGRRITIAELAEQHRVSKNHLMKIVNALARQGVLETTRGRGGGLRLLQPAGEIRIGDIVRGCETDFRLVACFDAGDNDCTLSPGCGLQGVFHRALQAFFAELDQATLADITVPRPAGPSVVAVVRRAARPPRSAATKAGA